MKQLFAIVVAFSITTTAFSQAGQKWSTSGNANSTGNFIGSTNNEPLVFKTNDIVRGKFTKDGDFLLKSLVGLGFRLLQTDSSGKLLPFPMSNANDVLYGDGTWRPLPTPPPTLWEQNGTSLYYLNGKVGIGTKTPFTNFDVIGDAYISNNLYVGGGIIITEKVRANTEVLTSSLKANVEVATAALRADSIVMDSTKGIYGYSIFKDEVRLENKLRVVGNTQIDGNFRVNGDFIFGDNKRIGYLPASGGNPEIISFGGSPIGLGTFCTLPTVTVPTDNQFGAMIQIYGKSDYSPTGNMNVLNIGYDGANGIIDMRGQYTDGSDSKLLINWYCGRDVAINTNQAKGGNVTMTSATTGMVGIGTTPTAKLDVFGTFKLRDGSQGANKILMSDANGLASWQELSTFDDGKWTLNGTDVYRLTGNVGIGTTIPAKTLEVKGTLRVGDGNTNFLDVWYDGAQNIIDAKGADLLINYYTNKNCVIGPGALTASGVFTAKKDAYFATSSGNVGIGTTDAYKMLTVNGDVSLANYNNSGGGNMGNGMSGLEILGNNQVPTRRGISLDPDPNGSFNFYINSNQTISGFNFKNGNGTSTTLMTIMGNGNVGIGTTVLGAELHLAGSDNTPTLLISPNFMVSGDISQTQFVDPDGGTGPMSIQYKDDGTPDLAIMGGNVGIGTTAVSGAKLSVEGIIRARRVLVNNTWADYVFETNYQLMPLADLETYITTKKHLPNVPTAQDVEKNGVDLGEINKILVEKVEELTLYIINMNKRMVQLEAEMKQSKQK